MTKLNHERWELRLADSLRREHRNADLVAESACSLNTIEWLGFEFGETHALSTVLGYFECLEMEQRGLALNAIAAFRDLKKARSFGGASGDTSVSSDLLDDAAAHLFDSIADDLNSHAVGFWDWYLHFLEQLSAKENKTWEAFTFAIMKRRLKPWLARHSAKWPPHVELFRDNLVEYRL